MSKKLSPEELASLSKDQLREMAEPFMKHLRQHVDCIQAMFPQSEWEVTLIMRKKGTDQGGFVADDFVDVDAMIRLINRVLRPVREGKGAPEGVMVAATKQPKASEVN